MSCLSHTAGLDRTEKPQAWLWIFSAPGSPVCHRYALPHWLCLSACRLPDCWKGDGMHNLDLCTTQCVSHPLLVTRCHSLCCAACPTEAMNRDGNWIFKLDSVQRACNQRRQQISIFASRLYRELRGGRREKAGSHSRTGPRWSWEMVRHLSET